MKKAYILKILSQITLLISCIFCSSQLYGQSNIVREAAESFLNADLIEQNTDYNEEDFEKVNHDEPGAFFDRSMEKYEKGFYKEAIEDLDKVFELIKECRECYEYKGMTYYYRGLNHLQLDSTHLAKHDFKQAFDHDPLMTEAYNSLSSIFLVEGEMDSARHYLQLSVSYSPGVASTYYNLGVVDLLQKKSMKAIKHFQTALEKKSCFPRAYFAISFAHAIKDRFAKAIQHIEKAIDCGSVEMSELYYWRGVLLAYRTQFKDSLIELNKAIKEDSDDYVYYNTRALVYIILKAHRNGLEDFSKAYELNPVESPDFKGSRYTKSRQLERQHLLEYYNLHKEELTIEARRLTEKGIAEFIFRGYYESKDIIKKALKKNEKEHPLLLFLLGLNYSYIKDFDKAYYYFDEALKLDDGIYDAHKKRGMQLSLDNYPYRAIKDFDAMIRLKPNHFLGYKLKANVLVGQKKYPEAAEEYTKVLQMDSSDVEVYFNRGFAWEMNQQFDKAIKDYQKVIKQKPYDLQAYHHKALSHLSLAQFDEVIVACDSMISMFENSYEGYGLKGLAHLNKGEYPEALDCLGKATDIEPMYVEAWFNRALTYYKMEEWQKALWDLDNVIHLHSSAPQYYYLRAAVKKNLKDKSACKDIQKAIELGIQIVQSEVDRICEE